MTRIEARMMKPSFARILFCCWSLIALGLISCADVAAQKEAERPVSGSAAATAPRVKATNIVALRELQGKQVTAYGRLGSTAKSNGGHNFLNFANSELTAVCFPEHVAKFTAGTPAEVYKGQAVEVTGKLELYKGKLQIKLTGPEQIKTIEDTPEPIAAIEPVELRPLGRETWLSPAGLRYQGRDPNGLNRIEHIMRHARDEPERDGPHGVFDTDEQGQVFALIDEAWRLAQSKELRPQREGDRSSYLVPMGRRIGYLGGGTGAQRGHPPISRIFIVFETGTKNIVTAFPK